MKFKLQLLIIKQLTFYNKMVKKFPTNYIEDMDDITYASIYNKLKFQKTFKIC